jgi:purine-binding chemotaxis protein CheW
MKFTKVPLAPREVSGAMNLRGRIVTAINVRRSLGLPEYEGNGVRLSVVVELDNELYSLIIDKVGDVVSIKDTDIDANPPTLESVWRDISTGIYKTDKNLMLVLDVPKLLNAVR